MQYRFTQTILHSLEVTAKVDSKKVPIMGTTVAGNKPGTQSYDGKATIYANTSLFRKLLKTYQDTGEATYFDITCSNEDPTASVGKQTIILKDCLISQATLVKMEAGGDELTDDISFTVNSFEMPQEYSLLDGMQQ